MMRNGSPAAWTSRGVRARFPWRMSRRVQSSVMALAHDLLDDAAADVGQAEVAAGVAVGQFLVVQAEQIKNRSVEVVNVDLVLDGPEAEVVGRAVGHAPF